MILKVYADRLSQPSRAVIIFCKLNGIDFEEVMIDLSKRQQLTPEFREINPMTQVPAIVDGRFKLFERSVVVGLRSFILGRLRIIDWEFCETCHAIMIYLASVFPGVADHWYPADVFKRAKIHSVLDWHHLYLRRGAVTYVLNSTLAPVIGLPLNPIAAAKAEKLLSASLAKIESVWLKENGRFLLGSSQPSIADLSLVCEIMQLEVVDKKDHDRILGPHERVLKWIDDTKNAMTPHFDEVHSILFKVKEELKKMPSDEAKNKIESSKKTSVRSKM